MVATIVGLDEGKIMNTRITSAGARKNQQNRPSSFTIFRELMSNSKRPRNRALRTQQQKQQQQRHRSQQNGTQSRPGTAASIRSRPQSSSPNGRQTDGNRPRSSISNQSVSSTRHPPDGSVAMSPSDVPSTSGTKPPIPRASATGSASDSASGSGSREFGSGSGSVSQKESRKAPIQMMSNSSPRKVIKKRFSIQVIDLEEEGAEDSTVQLHNVPRPTVNGADQDEENQRAMEIAMKQSINKSIDQSILKSGSTENGGLSASNGIVHRVTRTVTVSPGVSGNELSDEEGFLEQSNVSSINSLTTSGSRNRISFNESEDPLSVSSPLPLSNSMSKNAGLSHSQATAKAIATLFPKSKTMDNVGEMCVESFDVQDDEIIVDPFTTKSTSKNKSALSSKKLSKSTTSLNKKGKKKKTDKEDEKDDQLENDGKKNRSKSGKSRPDSGKDDNTNRPKSGKSRPDSAATRPDTAEKMKRLKSVNKAEEFSVMLGMKTEYQRRVDRLSNLEREIQRDEAKKQLRKERRAQRRASSLQESEVQETKFIEENPNPDRKVKKKTDEQKTVEKFKQTTKPKKAKGDKLSKSLPHENVVDEIEGKNERPLSATITEGYKDLENGDSPVRSKTSSTKSKRGIRVTADNIFHL